MTYFISTKKKQMNNIPMYRRQNTNPKMYVRPMAQPSVAPMTPKAAKKQREEALADYEARQQVNIQEQRTAARAARAQRIANLQMRQPEFPVED